MPIHFSTKDIENLKSLIEGLTGTDLSDPTLLKNLVENVRYRVSVAKVPGFNQYLKTLNSNTTELEAFISSVTIHTTMWFREKPHFEILKEEVPKIIKSQKNSIIRIASVGCSTGQEVYSIALLMDEMKRIYPQLKYEVCGIDIDNVSIETAKRCVYPIIQLDSIPTYYRPKVVQGRGRSDGYFTIAKKVRSECTFVAKSILKLDTTFSTFDILFCRNMLIYFDEQKTKSIVKKLLSMIKDPGILILSHCESIAIEEDSTLKAMGNSVFKKDSSSKQTSNKKLNILILDDSAYVQSFLEKIFKQINANIFKATSTSQADFILGSQKIDAISLDLNLDGESGADWMVQQRAMGNRIPIIIVSEGSASAAFNLIDVLGRGAQDYIEKKMLAQNPNAVLDRFQSIAERNVEPALPNSKSRGNDPKRTISAADAIVIGASTGGIEAIRNILKTTPAKCPPIVIVQHITPNYSKDLIDFMKRETNLDFHEVGFGTELLPNNFYMADGDFHLEFTDIDGVLHLKKNFSEPMNGHRPSIDVAFLSLAKIKDKKTVSMLLTGMGSDGVLGIDELGQAGQFTVAQSEESCVVFGMPKEAIKKGHITRICNVKEMQSIIKGVRFQQPSTSEDSSSNKKAS